MEPEKGKKRGERGVEEEEEEREGENQFSQTETGWSNGGLKEEEEEKTYFPLITSCSLLGKPSAFTALLENVESRCFTGSAAIRLWGEQDKKNSYYKHKASKQGDLT